jgi:N-methylhydantoinase A
MTNLLTVGVDVGGTFTDVVTFDPNTRSLQSTKVPSTENQADGVIHGLERDASDKSRISRVVHGTTVATNAIVQRTGSSVALVTTTGMRDVLEIGQTRRRVPNTMFDPTFRRPEPLVPRPLRFEVNERVTYAGEVIQELDPEELDRLAGELRTLNVNAVAVCFLHSYAHSTHEIATARRLADLLPDVFVTWSSAVVPEHREFERFSTTVLNAFVSPVLARYLTSLAERLRSDGFNGTLYTMSSSGGIMTVKEASDFGVRTILSGPVGGVQATVFLAKAIKISNVISCDMGGTSTDVALIHNLKPAFTSESLIESYPVRLRQIDINTVGAGGGSIAWIDAGGSLNVGPQSAGSTPGPACYGAGGTLVTVTDANLFLGRLSADRPLAGTLALNPDLAQRALQRLADELGGVDLARLSSGIVQLAAARMATATRAISVQRGFDPREFALVAFGGAGPMHACGLAEELGISRIVIPVSPGNMSAFGLLTADIRHDYVRTYLTKESNLSQGDLQRVFDDLEGLATNQLADEGFGSNHIGIERSLDVRYLGQAWDVNVPISDQIPGTNWIRTRFDDVYRAVYGHAGASDEEMQIVRARVSSFGKVDKPRLRRAIAGTSNLTSYRRVYFGNTWMRTAIHDRSKLAPGFTFSGPAIVEEFGSTTVINPDWTAVVGEFGHVELVRDRA